MSNCFFYAFHSYGLHGIAKKNRRCKRTEWYYLTTKPSNYNLLVMQGAIVLAAHTPMYCS